MLVLRSDDVMARVDPRHGAEVLDLVDLRSGRQLLGRPPFGAELPVPGDLDEDPWTAAWRGGWQGCLPNAGNPCDVNGTRHGFHGRASNDPWQVEEAAAARCVASWEGHGLRAERRIEAAGGGLGITTRVTALEEGTPMVALEHLSLGLELIEPGVEVTLPGGRASELDEQLGPAVPPDDAPEWPEIALAGGARERGDRFQLTETRARVYVVRDVSEGRALVRNTGRDQAVEITWSADVLPHLLVWHEARGTGGVWRNATEVLCIEPCSVPHLLGLAAALEAGQARPLAKGAEMSWTMTLRPV
jgi:galactose mutarotase-like enzyme